MKQEKLRDWSNKKLSEETLKYENKLKWNTEEPEHCSEILKDWSNKKHWETDQIRYWDT